MKLVYRINKSASGQIFKYVEIEAADGDELSTEQALIVLLDNIDDKLSNIASVVEFK